MSANVFAFPSRSKGPQPWTNDELAELYRVVDLLGRAGLAVTTDMGMSDEGDPWFVFCRVDNEEVIAHFARIDGHFVAASIAVDETFRGANFRQIVDRMVSSQPLVVPKPGPGSRLMMHPAVLLTAFVATALAHSEKMLAQDLVRAVEAQWDHSKAALLHEVKHIKTGWLDTLHSLWKLPLHDSKLSHDSVKETQALTLASLIAIAMAALQPIVEKISILSQIVADEFPGHGANAAQSQAAAHAAQLAQDGPAADMAASSAGNHGNGHTQSGDDAPQSHKIAAAPADGGTDSQKTSADSAHAVSAPAVQKVAAADDAIHTPAHAIEAIDVNAAYLLMQQKAAATTAAQAPEPAVFHVDVSSSYTQTVNVQDVTTEALQFLSIHFPKPDDSASSTQKPAGDLVATLTSTPETPAASPSPTDLASAGGVSPTPAPAAQLTEPQTVPPPVVAPTPSPAATGPQEINTATSSGVQVIEAITAFANNNAHTISKPADISFSASLQQELAGYLDGGSSLKIVIFDSTAPIKDVFSFAPGVVFVADKDLDPQSIISNHGGNLTLDVGDGQQVVLVGVATIDYHAAIA